MNTQQKRIIEVINWVKYLNQPMKRVVSSNEETILNGKVMLKVSAAPVDIYDDGKRYMVVVGVRGGLKYFTGKIWKSVKSVHSITNVEF